MTRFILSLMMLFVLPWLSPAREAQGSASLTKAGHETAQAPERTVIHALVASSKHASSLCAPIARAAAEVKSLAEAGTAALGGRLARLTAYWSGEGDYYTRRHLSSTGVHLHEGHCAVDPSVIPYGSVVQIAGLGNYLAVDTGTAVVSRRAAREAGHTSGERNALVIDLYFDDRSSGEDFAAHGPKYASISWSKPDGDIVLGRSVTAEVPEEAPVPVSRPEPKTSVAFVAPLIKPSSRPVFTKTLAQSDIKLAAAPAPAPVKPVGPLVLNKPLVRPALPVASVKPVSKHDTQNTPVIASITNLKGGSKVMPLKLPAQAQPEVAAAAAPQQVAQDDGTEHVMLAMADTNTHHKALYQF